MLEKINHLQIPSGEQQVLQFIIGDIPNIYNMIEGVAVHATTAEAEHEAEHWG